MRIILVVDNLEISGAEKIAVNLLRHAAGWRTLDLRGVVCMDDRIGVANVSSRLEHLTAGTANGGGFLFRLYKAALAVGRLRQIARDASLLVAVTPSAAIFCLGGRSWPALQSCSLGTL